MMYCKLCVMQQEKLIKFVTVLQEVIGEFT